MATHDNDNNHDHDNDNKQRGNEGKPVVSAPAAGALTSLAALETALNSVDTASVVSRSGLPMLQFKREGDGTWLFGQKRIVVEDGSRWAINPLSFRFGYICFNDANKVLGERLVPVSQPMPDVATLPDKGFPWSPQWSVNLKCLSGTNSGIEVTFKPTTDGGIKSVASLIEAVRDRLNSGQHDGRVSPIVLLHKDSYPHPQYGRVWIPVLDIVEWMALSGPAPAPAPTPAPAEPTPQPRRRRVG